MTEDRAQSPFALVTVQALDESEVEMVTALMKGRRIIVTDAFVWGELTEEEIQSLRTEGFIVVQLEVPPLSVPAKIAVKQNASAGVKRYDIGIRGPLLEEWRTALEALDVKVMEMISQSTCTMAVEMPAKNVAALTDLYFVYSIQQG